MLDPVAVLAVVMVLAGLAAGVRAHVVLGAAMLAMAVPGWDVLGPLGWAAVLGGVAFQAAGGERPVLARLPVVCDLVAMGVLAVVMPLSGARPVVVPGHVHGGAGAGASPGVVVVLWAVARCWIAWSAWKARRAADLGRVVRGSVVREAAPVRVAAGLDRADLGRGGRELSFGGVELGRLAADLGGVVRGSVVQQAVPVRLAADLGRANLGPVGRESVLGRAEPGRVAVGRFAAGLDRVRCRLRRVAAGFGQVGRGSVVREAAPVRWAAELGRAGRKPVLEGTHDGRVVAGLARVGCRLERAAASLGRVGRRLRQEPRVVAAIGAEIAMVAGMVLMVR